MLCIATTAILVAGAVQAAPEGGKDDRAQGCGSCDARSPQNDSPFTSQQRNQMEKDLERLHQMVPDSRPGQEVQRQRSFQSGPAFADNADKGKDKARGQGNSARSKASCGTRC